MGLFSLAHDSSTDVRKVVCTGLVQMLHLQPQKLQSHMTDIIEYMLQSNQVDLLSLLLVNQTADSTQTQSEEERSDHQ